MQEFYTKISMTDSEHSVVHDQKKQETTEQQQILSPLLFDSQSTQSQTITHNETEEIVPESQSEGIPQSPRTEQKTEEHVFAKQTVHLPPRGSGAVTVTPRKPITSFVFMDTPKQKEYDTETSSEKEKEEEEENEEQHDKNQKRKKRKKKEDRNYHATITARNDQSMRRSITEDVASTVIEILETGVPSRRVEDINESAIDRQWASMLGVPLLMLQPTVSALQEQTQSAYGSSVSVAILNTVNFATKWEEDTSLLMSCSQFTLNAMNFHNVKALQSAAVFGKTCDLIQMKWKHRKEDEVMLAFVNDLSKKIGKKIATWEDFCQANWNKSHDSIRNYIALYQFLSARSALLYCDIPLNKLLGGTKCKQFAQHFKEHPEHYGQICTKVKKFYPELVSVYI